MRIFKDRVAFVTGGASGIGYGMVQNFLKLGMKAVIVDFNAAYLAELRPALRGRPDVHLLQADVGDRDQVRAAAQEAVGVFGRIHVLCNNAGIGGGGDTHDPDFDAWDRALRVNLCGVVNCTKIIAPLIIGHGEGPEQECAREKPENPAAQAAGRLIRRARRTPSMAAC